MQYNMCTVCRHCPLVELGMHFPDTCHVQLVNAVQNGKLNLLCYADIVYFFVLTNLIQCFDAVGWAAGRASSL